jgi:hypothetical protein
LSSEMEYSSGRLPFAIDGVVGGWAGLQPAPSWLAPTGAFG